MSQQAPTSLFQRLPIEILSHIAHDVCVPVTDEALIASNPAVHGTPDPRLTFVDDSRLVTVYNEQILPDRVLFAVRQQSCDACDTYTHAYGNYPFLLNEIDRSPFDHFVRHASVVALTIRCGMGCGSPTRDSIAAAFYTTQIPLNLMVLSRLAMLNSQRAKVVDIVCSPRSYRGALMVMDFLRCFSQMTYGLARGHVAFTTDAYSPIRFLEVLDLAADLAQQHRTWASALVPQEIFLRRAQRMLDNRTVSIHELRTVALAGFRAIGVLHDHHTPVVNRFGRLWIPNLEEFTMSHIIRSSFVFITIQGLARHLLQQNNENRLQDCAIYLKRGTFSTLKKSLSLLKAICMAFVNMTRLQSQKPPAARPWTIGDLPYLLYVSAMWQTFIMLRIALLRACRNGRLVANVLHLTERASHTVSFERHWKSTKSLRLQIDCLIEIDNEITRLRQEIASANYFPRPRFPLEPRYNSTQIQAFVVKARQLAHELTYFEVGYFDDEGQMNDSDDLFDPVQLGPQVPQIPMISDWHPLCYTFDFLNHFGHLQYL